MKYFKLHFNRDSINKLKNGGNMVVYVVVGVAVLWYMNQQPIDLPI